MNNTAGTPTARGTFINGSIRKVSHNGVMKFLKRKRIPQEKHEEVILTYLQIPLDTVYDKETLKDYCQLIQKDFERFFRFVYKNRYNYMSPVIKSIPEKVEKVTNY